jgi:hypothetical protein
VIIVEHNTHIIERPSVLSFNTYPEAQEEHNELEHVKQFEILVQVTHIRERPSVLSFNAVPKAQEVHNELEHVKQFEILWQMMQFIFPTLIKFNP